MELALLALKKIAPYLIAILIFCGWTWLSYHHGVTTTHDADTVATDKIVKDWTKKWSDRDERDTQAALDATSKARADEQAKTQLLADAAAKFQKEMTDAQAAFDHNLAALRSGALRLRVERDNAIASANQHLAGTTTSSAGSDGSEASGLRIENADFLLHFGHEADDIVRELGICQAVVIADREALKSPQ